MEENKYTLSYIITSPLALSEATGKGLNDKKFILWVKLEKKGFWRKGWVYTWNLINL